MLKGTIDRIVGLRIRRVLYSIIREEIISTVDTEVPERTKKTPCHTEGSSAEGERYMPSGQVCSSDALSRVSQGKSG